MKKENEDEEEDAKLEGYARNLTARTESRKEVADAPKVSRKEAKKGRIAMLNMLVYN